jgi:hypothetical protein
MKDEHMEPGLECAKAMISLGLYKAVTESFSLHRGTSLSEYLDDIDCLHQECEQNSR